MEIKDLQKIEYEMLFNFTKILEKHDIPYWLAYGTCLGAARHHGFIPWDDDIDVYVNGEDLSRIKSIFSIQETGNLELHDFDTVNEYPFVFPKIVNKKTHLKERRFRECTYVCGVYIDVFPLFEISNNHFVRKLQYSRRKLLRGIVEANYRSINNKLLNGIFKCFNPKRAQKILYKIYTRKHTKKKFLAEPLQLGDNTSWAKLHKAVNFDGCEQLQFEGALFAVPNHYEQYLEDQYGDWRTPPPEDQRGTSHAFEFIEIDE